MTLAEKFCLKGKKAIVTGGAQGIGLNYAMAVASAGADVALADLNITKAQESADYIAKEFGVKTMAIQVDVTNPDQVENMCAEMVKEMGKRNGAY